MKILLIQPRMGKRPMDTELKTRMAPSLALLTIANILRDEHDVVIQNENVEEIDFEATPDIVGITVTVDVMPGAAEISRRFREKGAFVVAGGIHITADPEGAAAYFDAVCAGPAEQTWPALIADIQNGRPRRIYYGVALQGEDIVSPAYDLADASKYLYVNIVSTSRGCPYRCDFCYNSGRSSTPHVNRPLEDVVRDIKATGSKHILFIDDNFIGSPAWTRGFLEEIAPMKLKWNAAVSSNIADMPELLDRMKETGCQSLFIGFESLNAESLKGVNKLQNSIGKYDKLVEALHSRGIMINASFVFGLDGDDGTTFKATLDWIVRNKIETVTSHILTPFPGTKLYDEFIRQDRIIDHELAHYNTAHVVFKPKNMTPQALYDGYIWLYKELYSFKNIIRRMPKSKNQWIPYLSFNFLYRKFGRFTEKLCRLITFNRIGRFAKYISYKI